MTSETTRAASVRPAVPALIALSLMVLSLPAFMVREQLYTAITRTVDSSSLLTALAVVFADTVLALLVLFTAGLAAWTWFKDRAAFARLVLGGLGVILAYAASSTLKLVFTEARPCQSIHAAIAETCPPPGDWSWPSNHSVLAAAFATACALAVVRLRWYLATVALLIAAARVGVGAHYPPRRAVRPRLGHAGGPGGGPPAPCPAPRTVPLFKAGATGGRALSPPDTGGSRGARRSNFRPSANCM